MKAITAFLTGIREFRSSFTSRFEDNLEAYDQGRDLAHRVTFRIFEQ